MIDRLRPLRRRDQPLHFLPNWLDQSMADALAAQPGKRRRAPGDPVKLLYAGNIGTKQDLLLFCQFLQRSDAPFHFRIHGDGGRAPEIRDWVAAIGDPRFTFGPFMSETGFAEALHEADFFVITEKTGSGGSFIPCKAISGLASGSPILAVCDEDSPLGQEMREARPGPYFNWDQLDSVPDMLRGVAQDPAEFFTWQDNAHTRAEVYARDKVIDQFAAAITRVVSGA